ncbi:MAG TPA: biotin--[acetyl-CoA-carboxylase] ligase [Magnetospirillaceae bacterium]|nr:biotin--[acetyl-CoA-carboxylase] ligase [Magnetospirillaceae bacterium]
MDLIPIRNPFPGASCYLVAVTDSTMDEARRLAASGLPAGTVVAADRQTAGRGRLRGRSWHSEPGRDLTFTVILPACASRAAGLPLRAGLALYRAVSDYAAVLGAPEPLPLSIKWPNDLLYGGRKVAGMLCESSAGLCLLGAGVNCGKPGVPGLRTEATGLVEELGAPVDRFHILELFLARLVEALAERDWAEETTRRLWLLGSRARFRTGTAEPGGRVLEGFVRSVNSDGLLVLETENGLEALASGELSAL